MTVIVLKLHGKIIIIKTTGYLYKNIDATRTEQIFHQINTNLNEQLLLERTQQGQANFSINITEKIGYLHEK